MIDEILIARQRLGGSIFLGDDVLVRRHSGPIGDGLTLLRDGAVGKHAWLCRGVCRRAPGNDALCEEAERDSLRVYVRAVVCEVQQCREDVFELWLVPGGNKYAVEVGVHQGGEKAEIGVFESAVNICFVGARYRSLQDGEDAG